MWKLRPCEDERLAQVTQAGEQRAGDQALGLCSSCQTRLPEKVVPRQCSATGLVSYMVKTFKIGVVGGK